MEKIKGFFKDPKNPILGQLYIPIIIILIGIISFGLGRLSVVGSSKPPIVLDSTAVKNAALGGTNSAPVGGVNQSAAVAGSLPVKKASVPDLGGAVVASKKGAKYHLPWCSGAKTISEANKITFSSPEEARKAGYTPAGNCKGIK